MGAMDHITCVFAAAAVDFRLNSRLAVVKSGINYSEALKANVPDEYYFVWEDNRFRQLLFLSGKPSPIIVRSEP